MRLIDADALYEKLCRHPRHGLQKTHFSDGPDITLFGGEGNDFANMIIKAPDLGSDCETCGKERMCQYNHGRHGIVRINCPLWRAKG